MIFRNPFLKLNFKTMNRIKVIVILTFVFLTACLKDVSLQRETLQAPEQYVEVIHQSEENQSDAFARLRELQQIEHKNYKIGIGDRFAINVYGEPDLNVTDGVVKRDGTISIILAGEVKVAGLEIPPASQKIEQRLSEYINSPKVSIIPKDLVSAKVTIYGKVKKPGTYQLPGNMRILDIFAKAGGLETGLQRGTSVVLGDLERSFFVRNGQVLPVDFVKLVREGKMLHNIPVKDGDYIYIASSVNKEIYVLGEVNRPNYFAYKENMSLTQAIAAARGLKNTANKYAIITRGGLTHPRMYKINIESVLRGETRNVDLEPGDVIYIPRSRVAKFNKIMDLIVPSIRAVQTTWMIRDMIQN